MTSPYIYKQGAKYANILVVADHAGFALPVGAQIGVSAGDMARHIAGDIGTSEIATLLNESHQFSIFMSYYSRLWVDLNRHYEDADVIPTYSDDVEIGANHISVDERAQRLDAYHHAYHDALTQIIEGNRPDLIISLHSFTPKLASKPEINRPWDMGILYNQQEFSSKKALAHLKSINLIIGDQLPYSGKLLNASMDRHAEARNIPYFGVEIRQDHINDGKGQARFAQILAETATNIIE
ncbi:hypothetical protein LPB140_07340 [Sphingorhabdus lutea]|uniref:N-formylglutamate amidohydrolase n=1 Tax=Sphingorhabdus lutea TaxID=1913578 RepID=A0A1L3JBY0_9SPHN|nr:N-formylglutamate amidohydrolase [Sphingorhabdus lutea]APG62631.1 hypothetical protein LPB140_07340 [Sphingorhabdus lutea]